jgi:4-amino-4-deoxy-L-arabinose transferase-like glycosyltransferase
MINWRHGIDSILLVVKLKALLRSSRARERSLVIIAVIVAFGLRFRWLLQATLNSVPLAPDAGEYMRYGTYLLQAMRYLDPKREPVFPVVVALFFLVFGVSIATLRLLTVSLGTLMPYLTYRLSRKSLGGSTAIIASFLVATDYELIWNSTRGMREELFSCLLLIVLFYVFPEGKKKSAKFVYAGFVGALLCLTRLEGLFVIAVVALYYIWRSNVTPIRARVKFIAALLAVPLLAVLLWFGYSAIAFGDPFSTPTYPASCYFQYEFGGEFKRITMFDYIFRYHTIGQILSTSAIGFGRILQYLHQPWFLTDIGFTLFCLGFLQLLKREDTTLFHFVLAGAFTSVVFFFGVKEGADLRIIFPYVPILYVFVAHAIIRIYDYPPIRRISRVLVNNGFALDVRVLGKVRIRFEPYHLILLLGLSIAVIHLQRYLISSPVP